ncbi:MAG TPA: hypothetical protein VF796_27535, partial [Humisphaera sp.]
PAAGPVPPDPGAPTTRRICPNRPARPNLPPEKSTILDRDFSDTTPQPPPLPERPPLEAPRP